MIEVRAEQAFRYYEQVISNERLFQDRRAAAELAVVLVNRIRADEAIHVAWLRTAITEFGNSTIKTVSGDLVGGASIIDPIWGRMIHWHAVEMHEVNREGSKKNIDEVILRSPQGADLIDEFWRLAS